MAGLLCTTGSMAIAPAAWANTESANGEAACGVDCNEIVVTAAGFEQKITDAPASISVISREELQTKRFNSLAEALNDVEGVDVDATAGKTGGLNISIRGMPSDYTLILLDGRRQNAPGNVTPNGFGETSTSFLPPYSAIERIEVVRGPMSTLYGSDAMGGVVNVITRKVGDRWVGTATAETTIQEDGDFGNRYAINGFAQGPLVQDLLGLTVRGSYALREAATLEFRDENGDPIEVDRRGPSPVKGDVWTLGGRLSLTPHPDHDIWADVDVSRQWYDNADGQLGTNTTSGGYADELKFNRDNYALAHTWRAGFATIDTTISRNETETIGRTVPPGTPGAVAGDPRDLVARNTVLESRAVVPLSAHTLTLGGQYWKAKMTDGVAADEYKFTQWALYGEGEIVLHDRFRVTLGARFDDHDSFGSKLSPRAYAVWSITDALTLKGGVSRGFKTPRLDQIAPGITGFTGQGTIPMIGTPDLKPETSTSWEAGLYYNDGGMFSGNVTYFNNDFKDKIADGPGIPNCSFALDPDRPGCLDMGNFPNLDLFGQTVNVDKAVTRGVEAAARIKFSTALSLSANYTYTDSEQKSGPEEGLPLVNTPKHMFNTTLRWNPTDQASLWLRGQTRSSRFRGTGRTAAPAQEALGDYDGYTLIDLGGSYAVTDNLKLAATIYNLLDKDFVRYDPYTSRGNTVYASRYPNVLEARRLWLSATVDF